MGAGTITSKYFIIGGNTLDTNEWAFLDGLDQALKTSDSPAFVAATLTESIASDDIKDVLTLGVSRTGANGGVGLGLGLLGRLENADGVMHDAARIDWEWSSVVSTAEKTKLYFRLMSGGVFNDTLVIDGVWPTITGNVIINGSGYDGAGKGWTALNVTSATGESGTFLAKGKEGGDVDLKSGIGGVGGAGGGDGGDSGDIYLTPNTPGAGTDGGDAGSYGDVYLAKNGGNVRIGSDAAPTVAFDVTVEAIVNAKIKLTSIGGHAIKLTNTTGAVTVAGQLVKADPATDDAVILTAGDDLECIGVFLDSAVADDAEAWVVVAGIADIAMEDNTTATRGNWVRVSITEAGYADATNADAPQPINQTHFTEIGHCIETVTAGGGGTHILARCVVHFN